MHFDKTTWISHQICQYFPSILRVFSFNFASIFNFNTKAHGFSRKLLRRVFPNELLPTSTSTLITNVCFIITHTIYIILHHLNQLQLHHLQGFVYHLHHLRGLHHLHHLRHLHHLHQLQLHNRLHPHPQILKSSHHHHHHRTSDNNIKNTTSYIIYAIF